VSVGVWVLGSFVFRDESFIKHLMIENGREIIDLQK
jgi:hypothetical protein